jgi:hypothetical protein
VAGQESARHAILPRLKEALGTDVDCEPLEYPSGPGQSAAMVGLRHFAESNGRCPPLILQAAPARHDASARSGPTLLKWAAAAVLLTVAILGMRYAEALGNAPALERQLDAWEKAQATQPAIDRELRFFQYLATNRPPYLEAIAQLAEAAGRGTVIQSLAINGQGDVSFRGTMPNSKQATDFRAKLVRSGWFTSVVLEEQTPVDNEQKVNVRISAHWRPGTRAPDAGETTPNQASKQPGKGDEPAPTGSNPGASPVPIHPEP